MAAKRTGSVHRVTRLTERLTTFRLSPEPGSRFPSYAAGQYMALSRDDCILTHQAGIDSHRQPVFVPDVDDDGKHRIGTVTHPYSIASAPFETVAEGHTEFLVALEVDAHGLHGRLSQLLTEMGSGDECTIHYIDRITGTFTLEQRATECEHVLMIGTGTGVAPLVSMLKQAAFSAANGQPTGQQYTLLYGAHRRSELAYHDALVAIGRAKAIDFTYVPSISGPVQEEDPNIGRGRANNLLRLILGAPPQAKKGGATQSSPVPLSLPSHVAVEELGRRLTTSRTVAMVCGNPDATADIEQVMAELNIRCETEGW